jgi:prefoldin subunit 5
MEVKIKSNPPQTNPNNIMELQKQIEYLQQQLQQLQKQQNVNVNNKTSTSNTLQMNSEEFIVKANMKSSYIAARLEQVLTAKKKVTISALGYATAIALDSVMLIKKDLERLNIKIDYSRKKLQGLTEKGKR